MGFITGFASGFALTSSILYISVQVHRANRLEQRRVIREQVDQINWLASSSGAYDRRFLPPDSRPREERTRESEDQTSIKEVLKHRWNQEVEFLARKAHETRWGDIRDGATNVWKAALNVVKKD
ncbi:hypothetical protein N7492_010161 [Penicillium capsulatum]|uniref:MICOS complex subunit MIC12 n=1 Tax=Penicillium capsulatum TaxID=69766 RepID=A0A9W9LDM3_9EURO|nr:hypothetical protein N7492_010161 [Penicillium capsulatum]KAJ6112669.1 hypothetical protein N7512_007993 [Penicillium capsulatum]